jgi:hypothetical protein
MWFDEIKCKKLEEDDINKYEPLCRQSEAAQKVIEAAQQAAEEAITSAIVFRKRSEAIGAAKAYFNSPIFAAKKAQLSAIIPEIRKWLDYPTFHFDLAAWTQFYKKAGLGAIRPAYLPPTDPDSSERYVGEIRAALHFLFEKEDGLEERISQLLEDTDRHVRGIGTNLVSKFMAAHDPKIWFVYNKRSKDVLKTEFGYEYPGKGGTAASYLAFVKTMRGFKNDCGAEDCVVLDSFFSYWYETYCKPKAKRKAR